MDNELFLVTQLWACILLLYALFDSRINPLPPLLSLINNLGTWSDSEWLTMTDMRCDLQKSFEFENSTFEGSFCGVALSKLSFSFWPPQCLHQLRASQWNDQLYIRGMLCISKVYGHSWAQGANPISGPHKFDPYLKRMAIFLQ